MRKSNESLFMKDKLMVKFGSRYKTTNSKKKKREGGVGGVNEELDQRF